MARKNPLVALVEIIACLLFALTPLSHCSDFPTLDHLVPKASARTQEQAVIGLISRLIGSRAHEFKIHINPSLEKGAKDEFMLMSTEDGGISITATTGVTAAWGFYYYLTQYCNAHVSWAGTQVALPVILPHIPNPGVRVTANDRFRYYQNVCTVSYSFAWWDWERWEREIDWMALHSINLPLAFNGQEAIWQRVYLKMGFTQEELDRHFGGPAFLAWARMGNMRGWGGPLSSNWHNQQVALQHKILGRMRDLGMIPVLPAFAGHVPSAITRLYPYVNITRLGDWGNFNDTYCCTTLLDLEDPLFRQIGGAFIDEYKAEFGTDHIYNTDTFNEMSPASSDPAYLTSAGKAVYGGMLAGDNKAIWLMQGWLFYHNPEYWTPPRIKALLTAVPQGHMIILDLYSEVSPQYTRLESYYGQPFIWCMLHNFGGTLPMYGVIEKVNTGPIEGRSFSNSTMIGIGLTPEGINQNNVMYEFMMENSWRKQPADLTEWMNKYTIQRYGKESSDAKAAWQIFKRTVYNCTDGQKHHNKNVLIRRPGCRLKSDSGIFNCSTGHWDIGTVLVTQRPAPGSSQDAGLYNCTQVYRDHGKDVPIVRPSLDPSIHDFKGVYNSTGGQGGGVVTTGFPSYSAPLQPSRGIYNCTNQCKDPHLSVALTLEPRLINPVQDSVWYNVEDFFKGWDHMINASNILDNDLFRYDLVDVSRQALQVISIAYYTDVLTFYKAKNLTAMITSGKGLLDLLKDLDDLLATDNHFLLGRWIASARNLGVTDEEKSLYEYNARNQVTLWGPSGNILDYANKQWAGLVSGYYRPRWELFVLELTKSLLDESSFDESAFKNHVFQQVEQPFTFQTTTYPTEGTGEQIQVAKEIHSKYRPLTQRYKAFFKTLPEISNRGKKFSKYATKWAREFYGLRHGGRNKNKLKSQRQWMHKDWENDVQKDWQKM